MPSTKTNARLSGPTTRGSLTSEAKVVSAASPFTHAGDTFSTARALSQRVLNLAERLLSHYPEPSQEANPTPQNLLAILDTDAGDTDVMLHRANVALDAIESALP